MLMYEETETMLKQVKIVWETLSDSDWAMTSAKKEVRNHRADDLVTECLQVELGLQLLSLMMMQEDLVKLQVQVQVFLGYLAEEMACKDHCRHCIDHFCPSPNLPSHTKYFLLFLTPVGDATSA